MNLSRRLNGTIVASLRVWNLFFCWRTAFIFDVASLKSAFPILLLGWEQFYVEASMEPNHQISKLITYANHRKQIHHCYEAIMKNTNLYTQIYTLIKIELTFNIYGYDKYSCKEK